MTGLCGASAGPPFVTDDPEPVDLHTWEVNYGTTFARHAGGTFGAMPGIDFNYGAYPGLQLHAQPQMAYSRSDAGNTYGLGDTELGIKCRLSADTDDKRAWMVRIYPMLTLPTGDARRNLGAGGRYIYLPLWGQTSRGPWTVSGGGGYRVDSAPGARNAWSGGAAALYQLNDSLRLGGEIFGTTPNSVDVRASTGINIGRIYRVTHDLSLLLSFGHGVRNSPATNQGAAYFGLRVG